MKEHKGPLNGIKVLSIGTSIVGPWAATLMGYLGAEVFKVSHSTELKLPSMIELVGFLSLSMLSQP